MTARLACVFGKVCNNRHEKRETGCRKEMIFLEKYVKVVLYTYPLLETVSEDYAEHIRNKAILSYSNRTSAQALAEYLAAEIVEKRNLEWLKSVVEAVMERLSESEKTLLAARYFGKRKKLRSLMEAEKASGRTASRRQYFRMQDRLGEKVGAMLRCAGLTKDVYAKTFEKMKMFDWAKRLVEREKEHTERECSALA